MNWTLDCGEEKNCAWIWCALPDIHQFHPRQPAENLHAQGHDCGVIGIFSNRTSWGAQRAAVLPICGAHAGLTASGARRRALGLGRDRRRRWGRLAPQGGTGCPCCTSSRPTALRLLSSRPATGREQKQSPTATRSDAACLTSQTPEYQNGKGVCAMGQALYALPSQALSCGHGRCPRCDNGGVDCSWHALRCSRARVSACPGGMRRCVLAMRPWCVQELHNQQPHWHKIGERAGHPHQDPCGCLVVESRDAP